MKWFKLPRSTKNDKLVYIGTAALIRMEVAAAMQRKSFRASSGVRGDLSAASTFAASESFEGEEKQSWERMGKKPQVGRTAFIQSIVRW